MKRLISLGLFIASLLSFTLADAASISRPTKTFSGTQYINGVVPDQSDFNGDFNTIYNDYNGNITDFNIAANAAIQGSKLVPTFTLDGLYQKSTPCVALWDSSQLADARQWKLCINSGTLNLGTYTDAGAVQNNWISVSRSGSVNIAPPGSMMMYAGSSAPAGYLMCDGTAYSRTTYANLYAVIGTTFGAGDGSTTFNVPDFRSRIGVGVGQTTTNEVVAATSVNVAQSLFAIASNNTKWVTGMAVQLTTTGTLPGGLSLATTYYIIRNDATSIKFASTLANAQNSVVITLTTQGTGNHTVTWTSTTRTLGEIGGEESHAINSNELLRHNHSASAYDPQTLGSPNGTFGGGNNSSGLGTPSTNLTGGNIAMNIMQPFVGINYIIKQ